MHIHEVGERMSTSQEKEKRWWLAVALSCLLWGTGHLYLGFTKMGIMLIVFEALFLVSIQQPSWVLIGAFAFCTILICVDVRKRTKMMFPRLLKPKVSETSKALEKPPKKEVKPREPLRKSLTEMSIPAYIMIMAVGFVVMIIGTGVFPIHPLLQDQLVGTAIIILGTLVMVGGYRLKPKKPEPEPEAEPEDPAE